MMKESTLLIKRTSRNYLGAALMVFPLSIVGSSTVFAEIGNDLAPPPIYSSVDSHGVNLISGEVSAPPMQISIGTADNGLKSDYGRDWYLRDNYSNVLTEKNEDEPNSDIPNGIYRTATIGQKSATFKLNSGIYEPVDGTTGTLVCSGNICLYTDKEGVIAEFDKTVQRYGQLNTFTATSGISDVGALTKLTKPNGEVIRYSITGIFSSLGWMIKDQSDNSGVYSRIAINTSVEYCDSSAVYCSGLTNSWPSLTFAKTSTKSATYAMTTPILVRKPFTPYSNSFTKTITNSLNKVYTHEGSVSYPAESYTENYIYPSGIKHSYVKGLCFTSSLTCEAGYYPDRHRVIQHKIGGYSFGYSYGKAEDGAPIGKGLYSSVGPDSTMEIWALRGIPVSHTDNLNRKTSYWYYGHYPSMSNHLKAIINPDGGYPVGGYAEYSYDNRGNITSVTTYPKNGGTPLVTSATYPESGATMCSNPKTCNKPLTITDQNGVITSFDYYPEHGGIKTITKPSVNGVQAQTLYTYEQKTPYVKDSSGNMVANSPVWRLVSTSKCMTMTLNTCAGTADELRTEFSDFTNNLLSKKTVIRHGDSYGIGVGKVYLETTRDYDIYGDVSWENGPRPGDYDTVYYFYDALRQKVGEIGADPDGAGPLPRQATRTGYNPDGKMNSVETGTVSGTSKAFLDAMTVKAEKTTEYSTVHGLPIFERTSALGVLKKLIQKNYDNNLRLNCVAHRLSFSTSLDACALGQGTEVYQGSSVSVNDRITKYTYDPTGALLTTTSAFGTANQRVDRTSIYKPENGLLESEADANGNKTTYEYDNFKRPYKTIYPDATFTQLGYTNSFVSSPRLRDAQNIAFSPDALGRVGSKTGAVNETFTYNNFNQVASHTNNTTGGVSATSTYKRNAKALA